MDEVLLTEAEAAAHSSVCVRTFRAYVSKGLAPAPDVRDGRLRHWRPATIDTWIEAHPWRPGATVRRHPFLGSGRPPVSQGAEIIPLETARARRRARGTCWRRGAGA